MIGIDSSALIDLAKNNKNIQELLSNIDDKIVSTLINYFEIVVGIDMENQKHIQQKIYFDELFNSITLFHLDKSSSEISSNIYWKLKKSGNMLDKFDCMTAGIFLANGVNKIITRNVKHFEKIPGLKVLSY
jgi:tRNA(fMet)-specific endonuclease VapC